MYSVNHGNFFRYSEAVKKYIDICQNKNETNGGPYTQRYIGSMVSDVHRNLIKGGIFMYPGTIGQTKRKIKVAVRMQSVCFYC